VSLRATGMQDSQPCDWTNVGGNYARTKRIAEMPFITQKFLAVGSSLTSSGTHSRRGKLSEYTPILALGNIPKLIKGNELDESKGVSE
jgi:hypothetical protein